MWGAWRVLAIPLVVVFIGVMVCGSGVRGDDAVVVENPEHRSPSQALPPDTAASDEVRIEPLTNGHPHLAPHRDPKDIQRYQVAKIDFHHVATPFIISVWIIIAGFAKIGFHLTPKLHLICPESCILIVIGVVIGVLLYYSGLTSVGPLTPDVFFIFMLPPIILDAGYYMPNRSFFDNLGSILTYAVLATVWNCMTIGLSLWAVGLTGLYGIQVPLLDTLLFSSIISAVDPVAVLAVFEEIHVNDILYIIVFGESLLNDAVTVVLYRMFEGYTNMGQENIIPVDVVAGIASFFVVSLGGTLMGIIWGFIAAFISRFTHHVRVIEPLFVFVLGYLAYLSAELFHLSGILSLTFCGITMKNYVEENISQKSHTTLKYGMKMLANCSETIIFMLLGVTTVNDIHEWNTWFVLLTVLFITLYRALGVIICTYPLNKLRLRKLNKVDQFIMAYGGLRGAVAFALVLVVNEDVIPSKKMFVTTTIAVIYFTVFAQGMTIGPLVRLLNVPRSTKTQISMNERLHTRLMDHVMAGLEDITGHTMGNYKIRDKFKYYNNKYFRPLLLRDHSVREPKILETYSKLNLADAMTLLKTNNSLVPVMNKENGVSLASLFRTYTNTNLSKGYSSTDDSPLREPYLDHRMPNTLNFDMNELEYAPSTKDFADAQLHHVISDSMFKPARRVPQRYSRSFIETGSGGGDQQLRHRMRMHVRSLLSDVSNQKRRKSRNLTVATSPTDSKTGRYHKSRNTTTILNGSPMYLPDVSPTNQHELRVVETTRHNGSATVAEDDEIDETIFDDEREKDDEGITFVARTENLRTPSPQAPTEVLTETETVLPWKREGRNGSSPAGNDDQPVKQQEFPPWIENRDYIAYQSPSNTILNRLDDSQPRPNVFDVFHLDKRQRSASSKDQTSSIEEVEENIESPTKDSNKSRHIDSSSSSEELSGQNKKVRRKRRRPPGSSSQDLERATTTTTESTVIDVTASSGADEDSPGTQHQQRPRPNRRPTRL